MPTQQALHCARYLNLGTFRRDGRRVDTPVWFASAGDVLYAFSNRDAGKVKRLRNSPRCAIAPCTFSGTPTGPWQESRAVLIDSDHGVATAYQALKAKYGWQMTLLDAGARLGGRIDQRAFIRIDLPGR